MHSNKELQGGGHELSLLFREQLNGAQLLRYERCAAFRTYGDRIKSGYSAIEIVGKKSHAIQGNAQSLRNG